MSSRRSPPSAGRLARAAALLCALAVALPAALAIGAHHRQHRHAAAQRPISRPTWLTGVRVTEYYPVPERWFVGRPVDAPGLPGPHRIDWLYSATGVSMEGDGIGLDGRRYHIADLGSGGWINSAGRPTRPGRSGWDGGPPYWRAGGYWLDPQRHPTFPLAAGGWSAGPGRRYVPLSNVSFAAGPSLPLTYYHSVAVDPRLIPIGSRILIPAYSHLTPNHGWFVAADTGGAILGRHLDVYRPPPQSPSDGGRLLDAQRVYVIPPRSSRPGARPAPGPPRRPHQSGGAQGPRA